MSLVPEDSPRNDPDELELTLPDEPVLSVDVTTKKNLVQARNYETKAPITSPITDEEINTKFSGIMVPMLADTAEHINKVADDDRLGDIDANAKVLSWYTTLTEGFASHPAKGIFEDALADPNAEWRNVLMHNGQPINSAKPSFNNKGRGGQMSSERLVLSVRSTLGMGAPIQEPMMASGFYVTSKPLGEDEIIYLWREIIANPIRLGRQTHGLMFSNNMVFTAKEVYESWRRNVITTTVSDLPLENLADHLTINDLPLIAHAQASAIYPNGFPLTRAVFDPDTNMPTEEIKQLIDVRKSLFMNDNAFTDDQKAHMVKRIDKPMTLKQVKEYRDQFSFSQSTVVEISANIKIHLYTPSLREYFDSGEKWINEITTAVQKALGEKADISARLPYISQLAKASRLRQYAHYVKSIQVDDEINATRENVDSVLSALSANDEISKKIYAAISDYINHTQVALIATTSVNEYEDTKTGTKWPRLIPIDAISVFSQLVVQKLHGITSRELADTSD